MLWLDNQPQIDLSTTIAKFDKSIRNFAMRNEIKILKLKGIIVSQSAQRSDNWYLTEAWVLRWGQA